MEEHHSDPGLLSVEVSDRFFKIIGFVCFGLLWLKESEHTRAAAKCRTRSSVRKRSVKACRSETSMLSAETERRVHGLPSSVLLIRWLSRVFFSSSSSSSFSCRLQPTVPSKVRGLDREIQGEGEGVQHCTPHQNIATYLFYTVALSLFKNTITPAVKLYIPKGASALPSVSLYFSESTDCHVR